ncbi:hypothetical protein SmJEL517_g04974 [Synchytrium microbalum]|uniref:Ammonium transporter n=1 Tax=Synchytrium microbalum TaxID=1806994 RepID=A0A507BXA8_9FUNG|nr:uncharacterized protein SmJEL517_g04974 [Synchytrium microbalum]TPX31768.1 hypothetical protein SmJEL517_g04974 [Synchytrium microbalum]
MATNATMDWLDTGDQAWQLTAATLVGLQSVPGLMIMYGGLVPTKWAINSAFMCFYAFAAVLVCWVLFAYDMAFGNQWLPIVGVPSAYLSSDGLLSQAILPAANIAANFPMATMIYFQFVFAAITLILIAGALLGRMSFRAWMLFVPLWLTLSYTVGAFSIWGGGFLFQMGVIDYSGGYVIHLSAGTAGFVAAAWLGPRHPQDRADFKPHNILMVLTGAGILWLGWNGFNGGDPYAASKDAGVAVLNTNLCTAVSLLTWMCIDTFAYGKPSVIGAVQGMITGLVAITPAAGVIAGWGAIVMGVASGSIPWFTMNVLGKRVALLQMVDDTLGVLHTHAVAGVVGGFFTGILTTGAGCAAFACVSPGGGAFGNWHQLLLQLAGAGFIIGWNIVMTSLIMVVLRFTLGVRMSEEELLLGDEAIHGEEAYTLNFTHVKDESHSLNKGAAMAEV